MVVKQYITFAVDIELPDDVEDEGEQEVLIDGVMENADFNFQYDNGDGTRVVGDVILHSFTNEEPE